MHSWHEHSTEVSDLGFHIPGCTFCFVQVTSPGCGSPHSYGADALLLKNLWGYWFGHFLLRHACEVPKNATMMCSNIINVQPRCV